MSRINNYEELLAERRRLEQQVVEQKILLKEEFTGLKGKLEPLMNLLPILNIFKTRENRSPLLNIISSVGIDLVGQRFLSKAGWITRFIVPLIAKGFTSRAIGKEKAISKQIPATAVQKINQEV